nr:gdsl esterase/lipase [Quercus suber]
MVVGLPPMGCLSIQITLKYPKPINRKCIEHLNADSQSYNHKLVNLLSKLQAVLPGSKFAYADINQRVISMINNPQKYGFVETSKGCCGTGYVEAGTSCNSITPTYDDNFYIVNNRLVMDFHFFYVYYDGEMYYHELHGLSYQGSNQKQKCVKMKRGIGLMNVKRRILKAMGLDQSRHNISIVYRAPQLVVGTQVVYNSLQLSSGAEVKMMWAVVEQMVVKGFVASELYVTVEPTIVEVGEGSQHIVFDGSEPWQTFAGVNSTEEEEGPPHVHEGEHLSHDELHGGTSENEDHDGLGDDATHIDVTRDDFEEFLDTMGEHEDVDHIEDVVVEENRDTCPGPDPTPEWFTKNTWDNMFDPSPVMQAEVSSWTPGEQPLKGMVFATKLAVRNALTWYALRENFSFTTEHSDSERLMVSCEDDSCPWSVRAICCKGDNVWKIAKCKGPHTCDKIQNAHDGRMIDSAFLAYVLERYIREDPAYKIKNLRHVVLADLKHEVSHYKVDPTTVETEDDGVEDEYHLEDLEVVAADYMLKVGVSKFRNAWESMDIPPPLHASPFPKISPPIAHASSHLEILPPTQRTFSDPAYLSLTLPSFNLGIDFNETPPVMHTQSPSYSIVHTDHVPSSNCIGLTSAMNPPHTDSMSFMSTLDCIQVVGLHLPHKVDLNAQQNHLLVGQMVIKQDTRPAPCNARSLTKEMQYLLPHVPNTIRDSVTSRSHCIEFTSLGMEGFGKTW